MNQTNSIGYLPIVLCRICKNSMVVTTAHDIGITMLRCICDNTMCVVEEIFVCQWCSCKENQDPGRRRFGGGKKGGVYTSMKAAKNHFSSETHQLYLKSNNNIEEELEDNDNNNSVGDDNSSNNFNSIIEQVDNRIYSNTNGCQINFNDCNFDTKSNSPAYYMYEDQKIGKGVQFLIAKAFSVDIDNVTLDECRFSLMMANLLCQLTQSQQKLLSEVLKYVVDAKDEKLSIFSSTRVPVSTEDFDDIYINGKNAILPNLPHPVPKMSTDGLHAYVRLTDVLANEIAVGTSFDNFFFESSIKLDDLNSEFSTVSTTASAYNLFFELKKPEINNDTYIMYLWLKEWRDDFDPNNTKSSRNQVWINTYTICPSATEKNGRNTYFMAISSKGDDHSEIEQIFSEEINKLSTIGSHFYHGTLKKIIKVKLGKILTCVDRPERTSMFQIGDHAGTFSGNFGYAGSVDGTCKENCLPACPYCRKRRILQLYNIEASDAVLCTQKVCSDWNTMDKYFSFPVPLHYPNIYDQSVGAPLPPIGREIVAVVQIPKSKEIIIEVDLLGNKKRPRQQSTTQRLVTVKLTIKWLKQAIQFAHHNVKTFRGSSLSRMWSKQNVAAYLRSCGITNKLIDDVYTSGMNFESIPPIPKTWNDTNSIQKCHYAGMHMLFLGHTKSNYDMTAIWLTSKSIMASFGKQVNKYFDLIKRLRVYKYFNAHSLSTTKWSTGNWVSENYVFWARTQKFWFILPSIINGRQIENLAFKQELRIIHRFSCAAQSAMSLLMSSKRTESNMKNVIKIYMDTMVELDDWIQNKTDTNRKNPNYLKSNSLGILGAADSHHLHGSTILHWEGGYAGERKIQEVKPLLTIKRENANWQLITLQRLYQLDTIVKIMEKLDELTINKNSHTKSRASEGTLKIYSTKLKLMEDVNNFNPLSGILDSSNKIWLACRPGGSNSRSSILLIELVFVDNEGESVENVCWMAPVLMTHNEKLIATTSELLEFSIQFVLLLPKLHTNGKEFVNLYYSIGHSWTERVCSGAYTNFIIHKEIFNDWID